jgi:hypothetical protein
MNKFSLARRYVGGAIFEYLLLIRLLDSAYRNAGKTCKGGIVRGH